jgi:DNA-binding transcriptional MerR regulator
MRTGWRHHGNPQPHQPSPPTAGSAKALRLYVELGLLLPARVDEDSGYRFYEPGRLKHARLVAALRQLQVPLAEIKAILALEQVQPAERAPSRVSLA